jgi:hypothetical protein
MAKKYICPFCGQSSDSLEAVQHHVSTEPEAEPEKVYSEKELMQPFTPKDE